MINHGDKIQELTAADVVVNEVPASVPPCRRLDRDLETLQPLHGNETAIAHAAREPWLLLAEQDAPHRGVNAVRANQHVKVNRGSVLKIELHPIAVIDENGEAMPHMQAIGGRASTSAPSRSALWIW